MNPSHPLDNFRNEFKAATDKAIEELVAEMHREHVRVRELVTRSQLKEAILQMIESGDFVQHVAPGHDGTYSSAINYIPFRLYEVHRAEIEALRSEVESLKAQLVVCQEHLSPKI